MSETLQELADIPKDFVRDGSLFIRRCTKRTSIPQMPDLQSQLLRYIDLHYGTADKREFIKISQAVGMGFLIMVSKAKDYVTWVQSIVFLWSDANSCQGCDWLFYQAE